MHIDDVIILKAEAAHGNRRELAGEVGKVGDVWRDDGVERCIVVYELWRCLLCDVPAEDFAPAGNTETLH